MASLNWKFQSAAANMKTVEIQIELRGDDDGIDSDSYPLSVESETVVVQILSIFKNNARQLWKDFF